MYIYSLSNIKKQEIILGDLLFAPPGYPLSPPEMTLILPSSFRKQALFAL
jgi:hypothetical protein